MKTERYHTIGARRNPAEPRLNLLTDGKGRSLVITPDELGRIEKCIDLGFVTVTGELTPDLFTKVMGVAKRHHGLEGGEVKDWTTAEVRRAWDRTEPDDVETPRTLTVRNALTGDSVELTADVDDCQVADLCEQQEDAGSWVAKIDEAGYGDVMLLPDEWDAFFKAVENYTNELENANAPRKPEGFEQELATQLQALVELHEGLDDGGRPAHYVSAEVREAYRVMPEGSRQTPNTSVFAHDDGRVIELKDGEICDIIDESVDGLLQHIPVSGGGLTAQYWDALFEACQEHGCELLDENAPRKAVGHEQELADKLKGCVDALAEAGKDFAKSNPHAVRPNLYEKHSQAGAELLAKLKAEVAL